MLIFATQTKFKGIYARLTCRFFYVQKLIKDMAMPYTCRISGNLALGFCLQRILASLFLLP